MGLLMVVTYIMCAERPVSLQRCLLIIFQYYSWVLYLLMTVIYDNAINE